MSLQTAISGNEEALQKQSRSFAIPILNLDERFKHAVMVEYNLNKAIDTIEDATRLASEEKVELIQRFCDALDDMRVDTHVQQRMFDVTPADEVFVFKHYDATIELLRTLPDASQALSKRWTRIMADGMCKYLTKAVTTAADLDEYCYYVAGTVGLYLNELLFQVGANIDASRFEEMNQYAVGFGLFLQKLNIIRDFSEDSALRRNYWPTDYFDSGLSQVEVLNRLCREVVEDNVPMALRYAAALPEGNKSYTDFIRFILSSGIAYLKQLTNNHAVFSQVKVKLSKLFIKSLYGKVSAMSPDAFVQYCDALLADIHL